MLTLTLVLALALTAAAYAAGPSLSTLTAERIVQTWRCQDQLAVARTRPSESPWRMGHHTVAYRRWVLQRWTGRRNSCLAVLHERARQWNWSAWLPDKWYRIARCETGVNWWHANRSYVSAFGIQRGAFNGAYDHDAVAVGMPPWNDRHPPSPWQQWQTALSHAAHHGGLSGWGCRNA